MAEGWCSTCGHMERLHRQADPACSGLARVGNGGPHDGGDFAPCRCDGFVPLPIPASEGHHP